MVGNGKRLKGSQLGYRGKGVPDRLTILKLQKEHADAVLAGLLDPETRAKFGRLRELFAKANRAKKVDEKALQEAEKLAIELAPIFQFDVDDVDWDK
jgi:hypothetical protein